MTLIKRTIAIALGLSLSVATTAQAAGAINRIEHCVCVSPIDCPCDDVPTTLGLIEGLDIFPPRLPRDPLGGDAEGPVLMMAKGDDTPSPNLLDLLGCEIEVHVRCNAD